MNLQKAKDDLKKLNAAKFQIVAQAKNEGRDPTAKEEVMIAELDGAIDGIHAELQKPQAALTVEGGYVGSDNRTNRNGGAYTPIPPNGDKCYKNMFGKGGLEWTDKNGTFLQALTSKRFHPELVNSMGETTPSDGGFLCPSEMSSSIFSHALEDEIVSPRAWVLPMRSNEISIPALELSDQSSSLYGGVTFSWTEEGGSLLEKNPKSRKIQLHPHKLTGFVKYSSELAQDMVGGMNRFEMIIAKALAFTKDTSFLTGSGAGQPLGVLNAPCTIEVDPEGGQAGNSVLYENLANMLSRLYAPSVKNSVFVISQSCIPQLLQLSVNVGTGGSHVPVLTESNGEWKILTRPVIFTEKLPALGSRGCVLLADFSSYIIGLRSEIRIDNSIHVAFETDEIVSRLITRFDGCPVFDKPLVLSDGTTSVSPFVVLGATA